MMSPDCMLDTGILIYAATGSRDAPEKHAVCRGLMTSNFGLSAQALSEFYHSVTRRGSVPLSPALAREWVETLAQKPNAPMDAQLVKHAIQISKQFEASYWDGAVLAAAMKLRVKILYTESLRHGQTYGSVRVINPFMPEPMSQ